MTQRIREELVALLPRLRRFAWGLIGPGEDADDLVQAACEKALARLDQFQPGTRLDSWMFRIIQTVWLDGRRRAQRQAEIALDESSHGGQEDGRTIAEVQLTLAAVRREIMRLPDDHRVILLLICVEGLTYKEAAETLGIPVGTVMSRLARARLALVRLLERSESPDGGNVFTLRKHGHDNAR